VAPLTHVDQDSVIVHRCRDQVVYEWSQALHCHQMLPTQYWSQPANTSNHYQWTNPHVTNALFPLNHCNTVLAGLLDATIRPLQRIQNSAARLGAGVSSREHITPMLHQLHWLPVKYRIMYKLGVLMHYIYRRQCPYYLSDSIQLAATATTRPGLQSAKSTVYRMLRLKTVIGGRVFSHADPAVWNSLPVSIQASTNTESICRLLF